MFERFTGSAREAVTRAVQHAERRQAPAVAGEHLLLAMAARPGVPGEVLASYGVTYNVLRARLARAS